MIISDGREQGQFGHDAYSVVRKFFSCIRILKEKKNREKEKKQEGHERLWSVKFVLFYFFRFLIARADVCGEATTCQNCNDLNWSQPTYALPRCSNA